MTELEWISRTINRIAESDRAVEAYMRRKWDTIAKPLRSLGMFEDALTRIAAAQHSADIRLQKRTLVVFCADNGIVHEGVSQTGQDVTAKVAENLVSGEATAAIFCREADVQILPVDVGMVVDTSIRTEKQSYGTENFAVRDAMTREQALGAIATGIRLAEELAADDNHLLLIGEMGIGNTSTSSAVSAVLTGLPVETMTGRGAGLSDAGLLRKQQVLSDAIAARRPDPSDPVDVLAKVGGYDIAGMTGLILGAAANRIPVVLDGFISAVGALIAARLCDRIPAYLVSSHVSGEPAAGLVLKELGLRAPLQANMRPGEGCGAVLMIPLLEMAHHVLLEMPTFEDIEIEAYQSYETDESFSRSL